MTTHTTIRSATAIAVGLFFTAVTLFVLLDDVVRYGAAVTIKHIVTVAVLLGTVYFGHRFWIELRSWRFGTTFGCAVLFLAGTLTCVLMSAGRNAEVITTKVLAANSVNTDRIQTLLDREESKKRYQAALDAETLECATGKGRKCEARRETTQLARADLDKYERAVHALPHEQVANADIVAAASLLARLPGVNADKASIQATLELGFPFLQSLFCELAAICGFAIGLGHARKPVMVIPGVSQVADPVEFPVPVMQLPPPKVAKFKKPKTTDQQHVTDALDKLGGVAGSNDELAATMRVGKGESSKRVANCLDVGLIVAQRRGRCLEIRRAVEV